MKSLNPYIMVRDRMVLDQLAGCGVRDARVLDAMRTVAREAFVPSHLCSAAYSDRPLPIGEGQTISRPFLVATMAEALGLRGDERVLEVGTGSGYSAAVLAHLARAVRTIERIPSLAAQARATLRRLGYGRVEVEDGDGSAGWAAGAPYDAIVVGAQGPRIPASLQAQLKPGGRLVMPLGREGRDYSLVRLTSRPRGNDTVETLLSVDAVPLIGAEGWATAEHAAAGREARRAGA